MPQIGPVELIIMVVASASAVALIVALVVRTRSRVFVERWARDHGIALTDRTRPIVGAYLSRGTRWRSIGAVVGIVVPLGTEIPGLEAMLGYLVAAILFELFSKPIADEGTSAAGLLPRGVSDYLPARLLLQFRVACVATLVACASIAVLPMRPALESQFGVAPYVTAAAAVLLAAVVEWTLRRVAARRQAAGPADVVAADDALRSASMHAVMGAGIGIALLQFGSIVVAVSLATDVQVIRWVGPWIGLVAGFLGIVSWLRLGHDTPWVVRRTNVVQVHA